MPTTWTNWPLAMWCSLPRRYSGALPCPAKIRCSWCSWCSYFAAAQKRRGFQACNTTAIQTAHKVFGTLTVFLRLVTERPTSPVAACGRGYGRIIRGVGIMDDRFGFLPVEIWSELRAFRPSPDARKRLMNLPIPGFALKKLLVMRGKECWDGFTGADVVIATLCLKLERDTIDTWEEFDDSYARHAYARNLLICADVLLDTESLLGMQVTHAIEKAASKHCVSYSTARRVYYSMKNDPAVQVILSYRRPRT